MVVDVHRDKEGSMTGHLLDILGRKQNMSVRSSVINIARPNKNPYSILHAIIQMYLTGIPY